MRSNGFFQNEFLKNHIVQWLFVVSILLNFSLWGICAWFFQKSEASILLRFNVYLGEDPTSMGVWYAPYEIAGMAGIFLIIQMIFSWKFFQRKDRVMAHLMIFGGGVLQVSALIALVSIVLGNQ